MPLLEAMEAVEDSEVEEIAARNLSTDNSPSRLLAQRRAARAVRDAAEAQAASSQFTNTFQVRGARFFATQEGSIYHLEG